MNTNKSDVASKSTGDKPNGATTAKADDANNGSRSTGDTSEDFLIFGARPSHLFDDIAITIDSLLTEEVAGLPLLPRKLTEQEQRQQQQEGEGQRSKPLTGEEKLIAKLRKAYKKNLDLAEAYCSRNIFTVQYFPKTKRRKILENYLAAEDNGEGADEEGQGEKDGKANSEPTPMPTATFAPPDGELPSPEQIMGMDKEILVTRQRLQQEKQRRIQLTRQMDRLNKASQTLMGVQDALKEGLEGESNRDGEGSAVSMQKLKESVTNAMDGHEELKDWNARAEEVLQILDKIKVEREEGDKLTGKAAVGGNGKKVVGREEDERERKRMFEVGGDSASQHGTKEQVESLLKKLRGK
mmetsp:Transcript_1237/g.2641  ORF Transcript_1237/g.2641 Transcript_1237/m.2641 type:complete len:354 (+) Transcript_1237:124-1185(+)|eukprot:CAMPEP_0172320656 /NCGR_PEP_ID=MMETSP1058-20130122/41045_1 /TAXON_ID=83371 /ORGANISM="Detonula confervacea, Strain CCMP 353" /LENGTH=353 /DNA_ID=CAMNT_0013035959 /DNA_START=54 /DNA_END=1115 /DNA_ORIENTATION=+